MSCEHGKPWYKTSNAHFTNFLVCHIPNSSQFGTELAGISTLTYCIGRLLFFPWLVNYLLRPNRCDMIRVKAHEQMKKMIY